MDDETLLAFCAASSIARYANLQRMIKTITFRAPLSLTRSILFEPRHDGHTHLRAETPAQGAHANRWLDEGRARQALEW